MKKRKLFSYIPIFFFPLAAGSFFFWKDKGSHNEEKTSRDKRNFVKIAILNIYKILKFPSKLTRFYPGVMLKVQ